MSDQGDNGARRHSDSAKRREAERKQRIKRGVEGTRALGGH